tara:strand:- start:5816 stop:6775 length:960 start_codon:yes stop_codon:yes gene_type:complete
MTADELKAFEAEVYSYVGRQVSERTPANDPVNQAMIRHWTEVMGDKNPAYTNEAWAAQSARGNTIAPPAMMYVWGQDGYKISVEGRASDAQVDLVNFFNDNGYTGVLGTNVRQEYFKESVPGDMLYVEMVIDNISERKTTARGVGYFIESLATFTDQHGDKVGTQRFKILKFIPAEEPAAAPAEDTLAVPTRIASPRGHDNGWWWEACDKGKLLIQRCKSCQTLRHPPRPMCGECQSMEWDSIESGMQGEVLSHTELHHPRIPGYQYPLVCAVIQLAEGVNFVANVVGCDPDDVRIGMSVQGKIEQVDEKTMLPQFYPA